jgi:hypothetical protein
LATAAEAFVGLATAAEAGVSAMLLIAKIAKARKADRDLSMVISSPYE